MFVKFLKFIRGLTKAFVLGKELAFANDVNVNNYAKIAAMTYQGDETNQRQIVLGFQPRIVFVSYSNGFTYTCYGNYFNTSNHNIILNDNGFYIRNISWNGMGWTYYVSAIGV